MSRTVPIAWLLAACAAGGAKGPVVGDSEPPIGSGTGTTPSIAGERGVVAWWLEEDGGEVPRQALLGVFAPAFDGLASPATCGMAGRLCVASWPEVAGGPFPWEPSTFDPDRSPMTWVGDAIDVSGFRPSFSVDPDTKWAGYALAVPGSALPLLDLTVGGEWDTWSAEAVVPVSWPIAALSPAPGTTLPAGAALDLTWVPSGDPDAALFLEVDAPPERLLWRLDDVGAWSVPAGALPPPSVDLPSTIRLYRRVSTGDHRDGTEVVTGEGWSAASWPYGGGGDSSCAALLAGDPTLTSGVYAIRPDPLAPTFDVYCDMATDDGGWTLVASSRDQALDDQGVSWQASLTTTSPTQSMTGVWQGLRPAIPGGSDVRFSCKAAADDPAMTVDLSFYAVPWYRELTAGTDAQSCFSEDEGAGADPPPARRDNLSGSVLPAGDAWSAGFLEGEDACSSADDFTVDFDDRGMDGNERDGTDWGEDDTVPKCGDASVASGGAWFVWVR